MTACLCVLRRAAVAPAAWLVVLLAGALPLSAAAADTATTSELHRAAARGDVAAVRQLVYDGAAVDAANAQGSTPLHLAAFNGHTAVIEFLVENGAPVNATDGRGSTPLDWARSNAHAEAGSLLLALGAQAGRTTSPGEIPAGPRLAPANVASAGEFSASDSGGFRGPAPEKIDPRRARLALETRSLERLESVSRANRAVADYRANRLPEVAVEDAPADAAAAAAQPVRGDEPGLPAAVAPAPPPAAAPPTPQVTGVAVNGGYRVQLAALSNPDTAQSARLQFAQRYASVLGETDLVVQEAVVQGTAYYRIRSIALSRDDAGALCAAFARQQQDCIVVPVQAR
ncbi:MAG: ankyrin repeat domain-containing protein [Halioglobus sp.]|nr:ankyrin repeat domain-containing protein [Halioglobus sp.]